MNKLIILRGPSGSGKSTVAKLLFEKATNPTALIEQDHYRFMFKPSEGGGKANSVVVRKIIKHNILQTLSDGYDVILEGILSQNSYATLLEEIFVQHPEENYIFYFDISLEETMRRHETRVVSGPKFGPEKMKNWYSMAHKSNHKFERLVYEKNSIEDTLGYIINETKLNG